MRLFEIVDSDEMITNLVAVTNQLKNDLDQNKLDKNMSVTDLLKIFRKHDIIVDKTDLYTMIKKQPLKKLINNIENEKIVFYGTKQQEPKDTEKNKEIVANMAKKAAK